MTARLSRASAYEHATIHCDTHKLYRGETLEVEIRGPHRGYYFGVWPPPGQPFLLIAFQPRPGNTLAPLITPDTFAAMTKIELIGGETLGVSSALLKKSSAPKTPQVIFRRTGLYEVALGEVMESEDGDFDACWVDYFDYPRPKP